jgi:crotonobetainyl-CoA:carnitine CoA-transferase CaiB-like acyl-CoA transferase
MRARPGFARIFEAMSGFTNLTGEEGGTPLHMNFPVGDAVAGVFAAFSIAPKSRACAATRRRWAARWTCRRPRRCSACWTRWRWSMNKLGQVRRPAGNCASYTAPSNMYMSQETRVLLAGGVVQPDLCAAGHAVGCPEWVTDPRFATNPARVENLRALDAQLSAWFVARPWSEIAVTLEAEGIPFSKVYSIEDIERDPQFIAREAIVRLPDARIRQPARALHRAPRARPR